MAFVLENLFSPPGFATPAFLPILALMRRILVLANNLKQASFRLRVDALMPLLAKRGFGYFWMCSCGQRGGWPGQNCGGFCGPPVHITRSSCSENSSIRWTPRRYGGMPGGFFTISMTR